VTPCVEEFRRVVEKPGEEFVACLISQVRNMDNDVASSLRTKGKLVSQATVGVLSLFLLLSCNASHSTEYLVESEIGFTVSCKVVPFFVSALVLL
jgi:hypothetical protein